MRGMVTWSRLGGMSRLTLTLALALACATARPDDAAPAAAGFLHRLQAAITARNARWLSGSIRYPLHVVSRTGEDLDIRSPADLERHYDDVFTPLVVMAVGRQKPGD